jgi:microcystin-dependent protein
MDEPYIGTISMVAFNWAPAGWFPCDGRLLPLQQYSPLFALLGTWYGGDGKTNFGLPDLRGRVPIGPGEYGLGDKGGQEKVALGADQIPAHSHGVAASATAGRSPSANPTGAVPAGGCGQNIYTVPPDQTVMASETIAPAGGGAAHENRQPFSGVNFIIAYQGLFPARS